MLTHYRPFIMRNPFKNRKLQRFFKEQMDRQFSNSLTCGELGRTILDEEKNYPLTFLRWSSTSCIRWCISTTTCLLRALDFASSDGLLLSASLGKECIHSLGLDRFASALMWVLHVVFGMSMINAPWVPNAKDGRVLLDEIMLSGNFGKQDGRMEGLYDSKWNTFWMANTKTFRFWRFDHWTWFWSPVWRVYHFIWKKINGFTK